MRQPHDPASTPHYPPANRHADYRAYTGDGMTAFYNEIDPRSAAALRALISAGEIAAGVVDERSIEDIAPDELSRFTQCHFFAGIGVWSYALRQAGWSDDRPVWTGSCPCQPFSAAGKGGGFADERHLWPAWQWLIEKQRPPILFGEQVKNGGWIDLVQSDMEAMDYAFGCVPLCAAGVGAPHIRDRAYWVADAEWNEQPRQESCGGEDGRMRRIEQPLAWDRDWQTALAEFRVLDDGHPRCVGATDAFRNAIVAPLATAFIQAVMSVK